jgi:nitrous oxide reductase accessory protein NosL
MVVLSLALGCGLAAAGHKSGHPDEKYAAAVAAGESIHPDLNAYQACPHCGMDRNKFAGSRVLITYADGTSVGVCSLHCTVTELKTNRNRMVKSVEVADLNSKKLIDAEKAAWVIGGGKKGVMTLTPKWAFAKPYDAAAFIRMNGGRFVTYEDALILAEKD